MNEIAGGATCIPFKKESECFRAGKAWEPVKIRKSYLCSLLQCR